MPAVASVFWSQTRFCVLINPVSRTHRRCDWETDTSLCQSFVTPQCPPCNTVLSRLTPLSVGFFPCVAFVKKTIYPSHHQGWAETIKANDQAIRPRYSLKSTGCSIVSTVKINVSTTQEGLGKSRQNIIHAKKRYCTDICMLMQHTRRWRQVPAFQMR